MIEALILASASRLGVGQVLTPAPGVVGGPPEMQHGVVPHQDRKVAGLVGASKPKRSR